PSPAPLSRLEDLKGALHNHSTYSDGIHSLREMALYCKNQLHLEYLGICDHTKSAVYASGLSIDQVYAQWDEIDLLDGELAACHILKGIESDSLGDGSVDVLDEVMARFDFVVASIHGFLKINDERATSRLLLAIDNPSFSNVTAPT